MIAGSLGAVSEVLCIGAHPDDIEIGAAGTLITLREARPDLKVRLIILTGLGDREVEALTSARELFGERADVRVGAFKDGNLY